MNKTVTDLNQLGEAKPSTSIAASASSAPISSTGIAASVTTSTTASPQGSASSSAVSQAAAAAQPASPPVAIQSVIGPLPVPKTITITFVPDWTQEEEKSPLRAASLCVLLGPANTLPAQAIWCVEFNAYATAKPPSAVKLQDEDPISTKNGQRALLWYDGLPFLKYKNCLTLSKCRLSTKDELKTHSIVLRTHGEEREVNTLVWVRKRSGPKRRKDLSYLKLMPNKHYYLNLTFSAGSTIAQLVGTQSWRPIIYLYTKRQKKGIDEIQSSRLFTNFTTNWAQGVEPNVDERELKLAAEELQREAEEEAEDRAHTPSGQLSSSSRMSNAGSVSSQQFTPASLLAAASVPAAQPSCPTPFLSKKDAYDQAASATMPASERFQLQPSSEWFQVEAAINSRPLASIVLSSLDSKPFNTDFPLDSIVERFVGPEESSVAQALSAIEVVARTMATDSKSPHSDVAKHLLNCFSAVSQLPGWQHVQNYIHNPQRYIEGRKPHPSEQKGPIDLLQEKGQNLVRKLCQRVDWLLELARKAGKPFEAEFYIKVIAADRAWAEDASSFMKEAETKVTDMLSKNPQKFHAFRELQRKGVQWPHSVPLRREIESAGYVFRPMMIKRDRCVCETCGVEISGWRPYHNPWSFHNYAKHPSSLQPAVQVTVQPSTAVVTVEPSNSSSSSSAATSGFSTGVTTTMFGQPTTSFAATAQPSSSAMSVATSTTAASFGLPRPPVVVAKK